MTEPGINCPSPTLSVCFLSFLSQGPRTRIRNTPDGRSPSRQQPQGTRRPLPDAVPGCRPAWPSAGNEPARQRRTADADDAEPTRQLYGTLPWARCNKFRRLWHGRGESPDVDDSEPCCEQTLDGIDSLGTVTSPSRPGPSRLTHCLLLTRVAFCGLANVCL